MEKDSDALATAINWSCQIKAEVVASDEHEQNVRAILNFGHTFGHAIESLTNYSRYLHGEAIAIGMLMAADFSQRLGTIEEKDVHRFKQLLLAIGLPIALPKDITSQAMICAMGADKKVKNGTMRFVILQEPGHAVVIDSGYEQALQATLSHFER